MRYRIEYSDGCCNYANGRKELLEWLKVLAEEEIADCRPKRTFVPYSADT